MPARIHSRTNGRIGAGLAVLCLVVAAFDGYQGEMPMAALFGFLGLLLGLNAMDDLVWQGERDDVVVPLRRAVGLAVALAVVWAVAEMLF